MRLSIDTHELAKALYRVQGIADRRNSKPILAHALLHATTDGHLRVVATDLDIALTGVYAADVDVPGKVAVQAKQLNDIVKTLSTERIKLAVQDNHWVELQSGSSRFRLVGMPGDEFPEPPEHEQVAMVPLAANHLVQLIDRTIFCVSTDDNRYNLSGIYCESTPEGLLRMVATDGHRLALAEARFDKTLQLPNGVIVPRKGFQELKRVLADFHDGSDDVEIGFSSTNGILRAGSVTLATRLVDGQFPDYNQVIPKTNNKHAKIARTLFFEALRRVSLLSQSRTHGVRLEFESGRMNLLAEDPEFGDAHESIAIDYDGDPLKVGFNARYLLDVLNIISEPGIRFDLADDLSPAVIRPLEQPGFLAIVMPVRL